MSAREAPIADFPAQETPDGQDQQAARVGARRDLTLLASGPWSMSTGSRSERWFRMIVLAHRGWWREPAEKNSWAAFERAFDAGFGVETDVRDHDGQLVVAHDPPRGSDLIPFGDLLELYVSAGQPGALAINVKADGLQAPLKALMARAGIDRGFVFDMSVPDSLGYLAEGFEVFTRHSEFEPQPAFYAEASGVWIDCFRGDWITADVARAHLAAGKKVALVSPELHRRPHANAWRQWETLGSEVMICTDFPDAARGIGA